MPQKVITVNQSSPVNWYYFARMQPGEKRTHLENTNKGEKIGKAHDAEKTIQISIDDSSGIPIWVQLKNRIVYLILSGQLKPDERLPTVRELAAELGINYNTVMKVYQDIERDGYVVSKRGSGTFVTDRHVDPNDVMINMARSLADDFIRQCRELGMPRNDIAELVNARLDRSEE